MKQGSKECCREVGTLRYSLTFCEVYPRGKDEAEGAPDRSGVHKDYLSEMAVQIGKHHLFETNTRNASNLEQERSDELRSQPCVSKCAGACGGWAGCVSMCVNRAFDRTSQDQQLIDKRLERFGVENIGESRVLTGVGPPAR